MPSKKVMIVDDDLEMLNEVEEVLKGNGYETVTFSSGVEASRMAKDVQPDIILLDLKMPDRNGFMVATLLTRVPETTHIPIIGMTGVYEGKMYGHLMNICGFRACLVKPIDPDKLIGKIEEVMDPDQEE